MTAEHFTGYMACACGNAARYVNERYELCCGLCPIKEGIDAILLANQSDLHSWMEAYAVHLGFDLDEVERIRARYLFQTGNDHWQRQAVEELRWARRWLDEGRVADLIGAQAKAKLRLLIGRHPGKRDAPPVTTPEFSYEIRLAVSLPRAWTTVLKQVAEHHYDYKCREAGQCGVINGLHNTTCDGEFPSSYRITWRDLDLITKVMEQASYHPGVADTAAAIGQWLRETKDLIEARQAAILAHFDQETPCP